MPQPSGTNHPMLAGFIRCAEPVRVARRHVQKETRTDAFPLPTSSNPIRGCKRPRREIAVTIAPGHTSSHSEQRS